MNKQEIFKLAHKITRELIADDYQGDMGLSYSATFGLVLKSVYANAGKVVEGLSSAPKGRTLISATQAVSGLAFKVSPRHADEFSVTATGFGKIWIDRDMGAVCYAYF